MDHRQDIELGHIAGDEAEEHLVAGHRDGKAQWRTSTTPVDTSYTSVRQRQGETYHSTIRHRDAFDRPLNEKETSILHDAEDAETFLDPADGRLRCLSVQRAPVNASDAKLHHEPHPPWDLEEMRRPQIPRLIKLVHKYSQRRWRSGLMYVPAAIVMTAYLFILSPIDLELENQGRYQPVLYRNWKRSAFAKNARENAATSSPRDLEPSSKRPEEMLVRRRPMPRFLCFVDDIDLSSLGSHDEVAREIREDEYEEYVFISYTRAQFSTAGSSAMAHSSRRKLLEIGIQAARNAGVRAFWVDCFPLAEGYEDIDEVYRFCDIVRAAHSVVVAIDSSRYEGNAVQKEADALRNWGSRLWILPELLLSTLLRPIMVHDCRGTIQAYSKRRLASIAWSVPLMDWTAEEHWQQTSQLLDHYDGSVTLSQLELIDIAHSSLRRKYFGKHTNGDIAYCLMGLLRRRPNVIKTDSDFYAFARLSLSNNSDSILERLLCMQPLPRQPEWWRMVDAYGAKLYDIEPLCQIAAVGDWSASPQQHPPPTGRTERNVVVLDGVHGASICWDRLEPVPFLKRPTRIRRLAKTLLPKAPFLFLISLLIMAYIASMVGSTKSNNAQIQQILDGNYPTSTMAFNLAKKRAPQTELVTEINGFTITIPLGTDSTPSPTNTRTTNSRSRSTTSSTPSPTSPTPTTPPTPATAFPPSFTSKLNQTQSAVSGVLAFALAIAVISTTIFLTTLLTGPALLLTLYTGKLWSTQARFYGVQGKCTLHDLEMRLFGTDEERLKWSCTSSLLSRQEVDGEGDICGGDPGLLEERDGEGRWLFVLVDTYVMEVTCFYAARPPSVVMVCGREGGMLRGVLCSYDWRAQAFCREGVLRLKSIVLNRMERVDRFRFCLSRE